METLFFKILATVIFLFVGISSLHFIDANWDNKDTRIALKVFLNVIGFIAIIIGVLAFIYIFDSSNLLQR
jgi:predicted membrane channel-forming protein YqfA (hemolysin III family)